MVEIEEDLNGPLAQEGPAMKGNALRGCAFDTDAMTWQAHCVVPRTCALTGLVMGR